MLLSISFDDRIFCKRVEVTVDSTSYSPAEIRDFCLIANEFSFFILLTAQRILLFNIKGKSSGLPKIIEDIVVGVIKTTSRLLFDTYLRNTNSSTFRSIILTYL